MRKLLLKIVPVICIVNCGLYFGWQFATNLSAALYFLSFALF